MWLHSSPSNEMKGALLSCYTIVNWSNFCRCFYRATSLESARDDVT